MTVIEFKNSINLIMNFITRINEETIPNDVKKTMVKVYANTLNINLSESMIESMVESKHICAV